MPNSALAEVYFIAAMFILTFIISAVAVFFFFRTFKREKQSREIEKKKKAVDKKVEVLAEK